jgi:transposase
VDESGVEKEYVRERGRAPRGERIVCTRRGRRFGRLNVVAALRGNEVLSLECFSHSATGDFFEDWFKNKLLPAVRRGQTIIMDNASFHRKKQLRKIMRWTRKKLIFLPAYSPDLNRIEKKWANMKRALPDLITQYDNLEKAILEYLSIANC